MARNIIGLVYFVLVSASFNHIWIPGLVDGRSIMSTRDTIINIKQVVKTIAREEYEVIDCIEIYKQPAFDHPLLRNHKIQTRPSSYPNGTKTIDIKFKLSQNWHKYGKCPEGTIPIQRKRKSDVLTSKFLSNHGRKNHRKSRNSTILANDDPSVHEYAGVSVSGHKYHGAEAGINIWNPKLGSPSEFSLSQIWVISGEENNLNTIEAGWTVSPAAYGDNQTRLFTYWTRDNYRNTGCDNLNCPGFVQTNKDICLGSVIKPVSTYGLKQVELFISIFKDKKSGNWWLQLQGVPIGYWPKTIFNKLSQAADTVEWGGEIINLKPGGKHTRTQMGSGHFPSEGYRKSSYFRNVRIVDENYNLKDPGVLTPYTTNWNCYDLEIDELKKTEYGSFFYYGGPGYSKKCR